MKIENIEFADCLIIKTIKNDTEISIFFDKIYDQRQNVFKKGIGLRIFDWSNFTIKAHISKGPFTNVEVKALDSSSFEEFDLIQEKQILSDKMVLRGYSKQSGHWMEYIFEGYQYELTHLNDESLQL